MNFRPWCLPFVLLATAAVAADSPKKPSSSDQNARTGPAAQANRTLPGARTATAVRAAMLAATQTKYNSHCKSCHGPNGKGDPGKAAELKIPYYMLDLTRPFVANNTREVEHKIIAEGKGKMPAFIKKLSSGEIDAMIDLIESFRSAAGSGQAP